MELQAERMVDHSLRTKPIAIITSHHNNGTIVSLSKEAKNEGLFHGMKIGLARKISHRVRMLPYNHNLYGYIYKNIIKTFYNYTPLFEPIHYGQYYLDMSGTNKLYKSMNDIGIHIAKNIYSQTNMKSKIGISSNKLISKISTKVVPENIWQIYNGNESQFLAPLSPDILPICSEKTIKKIIHFLIINSIEQLQQIFKIPQLASILFKDLYSQLNQQVFGQDNTPVYPLLQKSKIINQKILSQDSNDYHLLQSAVRELAGNIGYKLRKSNRAGKYICIEIHYSDGFLNKKYCKLNTNNNHEIIKICKNLFDKIFTRRNRVRAIIMTTTNLFYISQQLSLFNESSTKYQNISSALDIIKKKFGKNSIHNGFNYELCSKLKSVKI